MYLGKSMEKVNLNGGIRNNKKIINMKTIDFYTVEYWQENWEELMSKVESGEHIGIVNEEGRKAVMLPADDELIKMYREMNDEAP